MRYLPFVFSLIITACGTAASDVYEVRPDGTGDFPTIQHAIDATQDGDVIELTNGTFTGEGNRDIYYGGRAITIRSQSEDPDSCVIDCEGSPADPHRGFRFVSGETAEAILEGVTIRNGYTASLGGAIDCRYGSSPTIRNCILFNNTAGWDGGGLHSAASSPALIDCRFVDNSAALKGGGAYCSNASSSPTYTNCVFSGNTAHQGAGLLCRAHCTAVISNCEFTNNVAGTPENYGSGGGMVSSGSDPIVSNCEFIENRAYDGYGGGLYCGSSGRFTDCTFAGNEASWGGAIRCRSCSPVFRNCTIVGNTAPNGSGVYVSEVIEEADPTFENTIIAFGIEGQCIIVGADSDVDLICCDLYANEGGDWVGFIWDQYGVDGNISEHPLFCDQAGGDYALQTTSPCAPFSPPNEECDLIGAWPVACDPIDYACCFEETCQILSQEDCGAAGGEWFGGVGSCDPNPCHQYACCLGGECEISYQPDCMRLGGDWMEGAEACDPSPCEHQVLVVLSDGTGEYATIQAAIDAAEQGWIVDLGDGTFTGEGNRRIQFHGKPLTLRSQSGNPQACVIDCQGSVADPQRGFVFDGRETPSSIVSGITVTGGYAAGSGQYEPNGGAVICHNESSPTFSNCILRENRAEAYGGALYCLDYSNPTLLDCVIVWNEAAQGGGINCGFNTEAAIIGCTLSDNFASDVGGGLFVSPTGTPTLENSIISFSTGGEAIACYLPFSLVCCDLHGNAGGDWIGCIADQHGINGNISEDPLFCGDDNPEEPYGLLSGSPCLPGANPECSLIGARPIGCPPAGADEQPQVPRALYLGKPYPNPSRLDTHITFGIPTGLEKAHVQLGIYDPAGRLVVRLIDELWSAGIHRVTWTGIDRNGRQALDGVYFIRLAVGTQTLIKRTTLLR